jgi:hypothetical protein
VGLRLTLRPKEPSGFLYISMSRNGMWLFSSFSVVNCMMESVEMVQKFYKLFLTMVPNDEGIIYVYEPAYRFVCCLFNNFLLKVFQEDNWRLLGTVVSPLPPRQFVRRIVLQSRNMWRLARV